MPSSKRLISKTRTWSVPTSPRSPHKLRNELKLLSRLDGRNWWEKDSKGRLINQLKFARMLKESDFFEGTVSEKYPAFSARDRCRAFWTYGFAFVDRNNILHITEAGWRLIRGERIEELFFKQLLKWQYPSWQHGGNPKTRHNYLDTMNVFPFVETLRVIQEVGWLTKEEIAIFLLPCLTKNQFQRCPEVIRNFRQEIKKRRAGRPRKEFIQNFHFNRFKKLYKEDIRLGRITTREIPTTTVESFVAKKMRNSLDYADAATRYFQYTSFLTRTPKGLEIVPFLRDEVDRILTEMEFKINTDYDDVEKFYEYMGNPELPLLPWENIRDMGVRIQKLQKLISETIYEIKLLEPTFRIPKMPKMPIKKTVKNLSEYYYILSHSLRELRKELLVRDIRRPEKISEIIEIYRKIIHKQVIDPALFFEWNTWRAFLALDDSYIKANLKMDDELMPLFHAGGKEPDIEVYFNEKYITLVEVTLSQGARQYYTETEPVTRHVGRFQEVERKKDGIKVYCIFIAPKIHPHTSQYFFIYFSQLEWPNAGYLTIIPISLSQFIDFLKFCIEHKCFNRYSFQALLNRIENLRTRVKNGKDFYKAILNEIEIWKKEFR